MKRLCTTGAFFLYHNSANFVLQTPLITFYPLQKQFIRLLSLTILLVSFSFRQTSAQIVWDSVALKCNVDMQKKYLDIRSYYYINYNGKDTTLKFRLHPEWKISYVKPSMLAYKDSLLHIPIPGTGHYTIEIHYAGIPREATNPPWDGGFVWKKDPNGLDWLGTAVQDIGSAAWWPEPIWECAEPYQSRITCTYPERLRFIGNGNLIADSTNNENQRITTWHVNHPINPYNLTLNIGDYVHWSDTLVRPNNKLPLDYYVIRPFRQTAEKHFKTRVIPMLKSFENAFGPYPFPKDGYALIQSAYAGLEHQGAIAYGNGFIDGYRGKDYSGVGILFDFILIHETGHEWWGNSVTAATADDFWMQEAFCTYAEVIYVRDVFGEKESYQYIKAKERLVDNETPIMPGSRGGTDMYTKGALMLNTLRTLVDNDSVWFNTLKKLALDFAHACITTKELMHFLSENLNINVQPLFYEYLYKTNPPKLTVQPALNPKLTQIYKFSLQEAEKDFSLPLIIQRNGKNELFKISNTVTEIQLSPNDKILSEYSYFTFN